MPDLDAWKKTIRKLDDAFGDYILVLKCRCGHVAYREPWKLAEHVEWDTPLEEIAKRAKCSKCNARGAEWTVEKVGRRPWLRS